MFGYSGECSGMARFLILTFPVDGHVAPTIPIARKLVERRHEVRWITGRIYEDRIKAIGAQFHPLPKEIDPEGKEVYDIFPQLNDLKGFAQIKWYIKHVFLDSAPLQIESIDAVLADYPADVLVGDSVTCGVYYKSEMGGPPSAMISLTPLAVPSRDTAPYGLALLPGRNGVTKVRDRFLRFATSRVLLRDVHIHADRVRRGLGLEPVSGPLFRYYYEIPSLLMQVSTPVFEYPRSDQPEHLHFIGPVVPPPEAEFREPGWWGDLNASRAVVLVNQGTVATNIDNLVSPAIDGLRDQDMLVVAVPVKRGQLRELPEHVRAEPFIPFGNLLPHVDVMVSNGGYGGTQMALSHGVPVVIAGATEDKMEVAARVEWSGAGINLRTQQPSPVEIRDAVKEVLANPTYRENSRRIQSDFAGYDAPTRAAELLECLASDEPV